jgi:predicted dehydrogenase
MSTVTAVLCGAGVRGRDVYGAYALRHPERLRFVAVAEPSEARRLRFCRRHGIPEDRAFTGTEELLARGRLAEAAFVCTPDAGHFAPALAALRLGYHLLLEKPMSPRLEECRTLAGLPLAAGQLAQVAHVLRYTAFWRTLREAVAGGAIGQIVHFDLTESVSTWHFAHSYVRGSYAVEERSSPLILAKTCHDLDLMAWILGERALSVESTGGLQYYRPENAPAGAPERCTDGCPAEVSCPWFAPRLYLRGEPILRTVLHSRSPGLRWLVRTGLRAPRLMGVLGRVIPPLGLLANWTGFPSSAIAEDLSPEGKLHALREGPYGRCVYRCGNDVVDHQVATFRFPSGATATLTVHGFSEFEGREVRLFGSRGALRGLFRIQGEELTLTDHRSLRTCILYRRGVNPEGHGGGDWALLDAFTGALRSEVDAAQAGLSGPAEALESHLLAFAAEESRRSGASVSLAAYREAPTAGASAAGKPKGTRSRRISRSMGRSRTRRPG